LGILINTLIEKPVESLAGLGFTALGIPVYYYWRKKSGQELNKSHPQGS
jgi:APA family basic amino acid/polyamine antiporter